MATEVSKKWDVRADDSTAINTLGLRLGPSDGWVGVLRNTDAEACSELFPKSVSPRPSVAIVGTGGVARAVWWGGWFGEKRVYGRTKQRALDFGESIGRPVDAHSMSELPDARVDVYVNCTPVGMAGGPDPDGMSIPVDDIKPAPETVFFDTVYNPIETPMLKAAKRWGCQTIDGVEMFVKQAAGQFELWTGESAPVELFDRLVRERLG